MVAKLWDGTTVAATAACGVAAGLTFNSIALSGTLTNPAGKRENLSERHHHDEWEDCDISQRRFGCFQRNGCSHCMKRRQAVSMVARLTKYSVVCKGAACGFGRLPGW